MATTAPLGFVSSPVKEAVTPAFLTITRPLMVVKELEVTQQFAPLRCWYIGFELGFIAIVFGQVLGAGSDHRDYSS